MVKKLPAMQETQEIQVQSLDGEDPLGRGWGMATHFSVLAWEIPCSEEPVGLESIGLQRVGLDQVIEQHIFFLWISKMKSSLYLPIYLETVNHSFSL